MGTWGHRHRVRRSWHPIFTGLCSQDGWVPGLYESKGVHRVLDHVWSWVLGRDINLDGQEFREQRKKDRFLTVPHLLSATLNAAA